MPSSLRVARRTSYQARILSAILPAILLSLPVLHAAAPQANTVVHIDASAPYQEPVAALYDAGSSVAPNGDALGVNSRYLTRNGMPWLPVMGEFHFSRVPRNRWEEELLKMKSAGVNIVATYVIWIHHEEVRGQYDWSGDRDLRAFAQLCAKHGLLLEPRIGPWAHAEARNGGLPDWVMKQGPTRVNDPAYMAAVSAWFAQIGDQLKGLMWKDGGPVVAIQIENEYAVRGAGAGEEHILALKKIAREDGMDAPLYLVTGWDNAVVPAREVMPVYGGGYPDAPWDGSTEKLAPPEVYAFRFNSRVAANMGAMGAKDKSILDASALQPVPYMTAEIGGGIEDTYHRRPVIHADDIGSMYPVMLGSGVNLYGTYMFQGGENPDGKLTTLQESQATGYPNDLPIKSYDFQAPLGEFGDERASLRKMKTYQYFLNSFGADLAPMRVSTPDQLPASPADFSIPRAALRSKGDSGFLFFNNYVRNYTMPVRRGMQFEVKLPSGTLLVPSRAVDVPAGAYFLWPLHMRMGAADLIYATAQPFTRLESKDASTLVFAGVDGIPVEFAFQSASVASLHASGGETRTESGVTYVRNLKAGASAWIDVVDKNGVKTHVIVLSQTDAEYAWKVKWQGAERLLITAQDVFVEESGQVHLRSRGAAKFEFAVLPALTAKPTASLPIHAEPAKSGVAQYSALAPTRELKLEITAEKAPGVAPAVKLAPPPSWRAKGVAQAPDEGRLAAAGMWKIRVPQDAMRGLSELYLDLRYQGDVARLYKNGKLLEDDFFNGLSWKVGLSRFLQGHDGAEFELEILPLRKDAPIYFETPQVVRFDAQGQAIRVEGGTLLPEYEMTVAAVE